MKTRDLFAGCSVTVAPHDDVWLVSLVDDALKSVTMRTYHELPDAIEAAHEWLLMLSDETEIHVDMESRRQAAQILREALARNALGEELVQPKLVDEARQRDELRAWFEREMGK